MAAGSAGQNPSSEKNSAISHITMAIAEVQSAKVR